MFMQEAFCWSLLDCLGGTFDRRRGCIEGTKWRMANCGPRDYVSATSAAHRLGVSTRTLRRYTLDGWLPDARSAGGRRIFRLARFGVGVIEHLLAGYETAARGGRSRNRRRK
jgi:hypothetical protein